MSSLVNTVEVIFFNEDNNFKESSVIVRSEYFSSQPEEVKRKLEAYGIMNEEEAIEYGKQYLYLNGVK